MDDLTSHDPSRRLRLWGVGLVLVGVAVIIAGARVLSRPGKSPQTVVLYSSVDDTLVRAVVADLEARTGLRVQLVGDSEATKTTGLVTRLINEKDRPRADVWWSSEAMGTIRLARAGVLAPVDDAPFAKDWPAGWRDSQGRWFAFAARARVIAFSTDRIETPPTSLAALTEPGFRGRVGMARPQFGTTRSHMADLVARWGPEAFEAWLAAMRDNKLRLYDGNASVVRAIARGEIDIGLTDTDDVYAAQRNNWAVGLVFEAADSDTSSTRWTGDGPMLVPNTAALIAGGPNPDGGRELLGAILSEETERLLAHSDSRNTPMHTQVARDFPGLAIPHAPADPASHADDIASHADQAITICERVLAGQ